MYSYQIKTSEVKKYRKLYNDAIKRIIKIMQNYDRYYHTNKYEKAGVILDKISDTICDELWYIEQHPNASNRVRKMCSKLDDYITENNDKLIRKLYNT